MRTLYHLPLSPFCRKIRLALAEKRIPFDMRIERVWERREEFLAMNPACTVPVMQDSNGLILADSWAIGEYLDEAYPDIPLLGLTLALGDKWAPDGVRVNLVAPGFIATRMTEGTRTNPEREKKLMRAIPMQRWGEPDEIASAILFLASPAARYITGQVIAVDGGMTM
jgi:hypothetical protein